MIRGLPAFASIVIPLAISCFLGTPYGFLGGLDATEGFSLRAELGRIGRVLRISLRLSAQMGVFVQ